MLLQVTLLLYYKFYLIIWQVLLHNQSLVTLGVNVTVTVLVLQPGWGGDWSAKKHIRFKIVFIYCYSPFHYEHSSCPLPHPLIFNFSNQEKGSFNKNGSYLKLNAVPWHRCHPSWQWGDWATGSQAKQWRGTSEIFLIESLLEHSTLKFPHTNHFMLCIGYLLPNISKTSKCHYKHLRSV